MTIRWLLCNVCRHKLTTDAWSNNQYFLLMHTGCINTASLRRKKKNTATCDLDANRPSITTQYVFYTKELLGVRSTALVTRLYTSHRETTTPSPVLNCHSRRIPRQRNAKGNLLLIDTFSKAVKSYKYKIFLYIYALMLNSI